ncbi:TPA: Dot/Icm T4SS effector Lem19 [Legionella pneumophila]|nr:Dot/Icm T4SS effector Lem19 [Legionella pneumophila]
MIDMISITTYWQQFKDCIDQLRSSVDNKEYSNQIATADLMIEIGLTIEQLGITQIQQVGDRLHEKAKLFGYRVPFVTPEKKYEFCLPKITNAETLIFAIVYYQHLKNYENVEYQGSINWFRSKVTHGVNEKKISTRAQSEAMLGEIRQYCQSQNIAFNESEFIKKNDESAKEYTTRLFKNFHADKTAKSEPIGLKQLNESKESNLSDELAKLEKSFEDSRNKRNQLIVKIDALAKKLADYHLLSQNHHKLNNEWNNKWFFTKFFDWIMSWFSNDSFIKNLKTSYEQVINAEHELKQEFHPFDTADAYRAELKKQLEETHIECDKNQKQINEYQLKQLEYKLEQRLEQKLQEKLQKDTAVEQKEPSVTKVLSEIKHETNGSDFSSNLNHYYGFFKEHLPNRETLGAIAVGAAAIAIQNLM